MSNLQYCLGESLTYHQLMHWIFPWCWYNCD